MINNNNLTLTEPARRQHTFRQSAAGQVELARFPRSLQRTGRDAGSSDFRPEARQSVLVLVSDLRHQSDRGVPRIEPTLHHGHLYSASRKLRLALRRLQ